MAFYKSKNRTRLLLDEITSLENEIESMESSYHREDLCGDLIRLYHILRTERDQPSLNNNTGQINKMTTPLDQTKSSRFNRHSFFHVCTWMNLHINEITPGKTAQELVDFLNDVKDIEEYVPQGGIGVHSAPALIRATGYIGAVVGQKGSMVRTKITVTKFNQLKREVGKLKDQVKTVKDSQAKLITVFQEIRQLIQAQGLELTSKMPTNATAAEDTPDVVEITTPDIDEQPEYGTLSSEGREPKDKDAFDMFQESANFEPSPEIQALIDKGNEEARNDDQTANLPG